MRDAVFGLYVVVDVLGAVGAILVAVPVLREYGLKHRWQRLRSGDPIPGLESAEGAAAQQTKVRLESFRPGDAAYIAWGLVIISGSYALHIAAAVLERLTAPPG